LETNIALKKKGEMNMRNLYRFEILLTLVAAYAASAAAQGVPMNCKPDFTVCYIPKNVLVVSPNAGYLIAGDAVIGNPNSTGTEAVYRIFNDFSNTNRGTGTGSTLFLYSKDGTARMPDPSTYSANMATAVGAASGPTMYTGPFANGGITVYQLDLNAAPVTVQYTGATTSGASAAVQLSAVVTSGGSPVGGGAMYFTLGNQSCNAQTDAAGKAACTIVLNQHLGHQDVVAAFGGIFGAYAGGSDTKSFIVTGQ
jgi:hypothetical protein